MKLSMSMLSWYLREHRPVCHIEDDELSIEGLRFVLDDADTMLPQYLYFCNAETFFSSSQYAGSYLAVNRHSTMLFMDSDYNTLLNKILSAFEFFTNLEGRLLEAASANAPLKTFLNIMAPVLENPFLIANLDSSYRLTTDYTGHRVDPLWARTCDGSMRDHPSLYVPYYDIHGNRIGELSEQPRLVKNVYEGGDPVMMLYLKKNGENVGSIAILQEHPELTAQNLQLAPVLARYCILAQEFTSSSGQIQSGTALFLNLLEGREIGPENTARIRACLPPAPWRLLQFRLTQRTDHLAKNALMRNLQSMEELCFPTAQADVCCALIPESGLQRRLRSPGPAFPLNGVTIDASMPFSDLATLPLRKEQAQFVWEQAGNEAGAHLCEQFACDYLLGTFRSMGSTKNLLHPALEILRKYDGENRTELLQTLSVFLHQERNQLFSARAMHIHPNTIRYRLQRVTELTGLTLEDPAELKYLRLSLWLDPG